jgi:hypothetical protein
MIDDHPRARPQAGLTQASVVWHAPAEFGIPRYMAVFQEQMPGTIGPVRSAREYFVAWAGEWHSLLARVGGSPGARRLLREQGDGQLLFDGDEYQYKSSYYRISQRVAPHNLYTNGERLRALAEAVGATDGPIEPVWQFGPDLAAGKRPRGGRIEVAYPANAVRYDYDARTNTYPRSVSGGRPQIDAGRHKRVAPRNVVVMLVPFAPLNDGTSYQRLDARYIGSGTAWIATNGTTIKGTWRKASLAEPTLFFDAAGDPMTFTAGQTFIQVVPTGTRVRITPGT